MTKENYPVEGAGLWAAWAGSCPCPWGGRRGCGASPPRQQLRQWCQPAIVTFSMVFCDDSERVLRLHLKVTQHGREGWVVVLQLRIGVHDFGSPLQKQRIPANYPLHLRRLWKNCCFQLHRKWTLILLSLSMACSQNKPNQTAPPCTSQSSLHTKPQAADFVPVMWGYGYYYHMAANFHQMVVLHEKNSSLLQM